MGWNPQADGTLLEAGTPVQITYGSMCFGMLTDTDRRAALNQASISVSSFNDLAITPSIFATTVRQVSVGQLRTEVTAAFDALRNRGDVACVYVDVKDVLTWTGSVIPEVPTSTAVSIAGFAVIALVGFLVYRNFISMR